MNKLIVVFVAVLGTLQVGHSWALPVYGDNPLTEPTFADWETNPPLPTETGYYIFSDLSQENWSIRWTGNNNGAKQKLDYYGTITLADTQTLISYSNLEWDNYDSPLVVNGSTITWKAGAGRLYDGIDFSISGPSGAVMLFELGAILRDGEIGETVFDSLTAPANNVPGLGIYISDNYNVPYVDVVDIDGRVFQRLGLDPMVVPEPGTILLLGTGMFGLAALRRRRSS